MGTVISVLRWVAVLPGPVLSATFAPYIVSDAVRWTAPNANGFVAQFGIGCIVSTAFVLALVFSGAWIAPSKKNATVLMLTVVGMVNLAIMVNGGESISDPRSLGALIALIATSGYVLVMAWRGKGVFDASGFFRD